MRQPFLQDKRNWEGLDSYKQTGKGIRNFRYDIEDARI